MIIRLGTACALSAHLWLAAITPAGANACITTLPVSYAFSSEFGAAYDERIPVRITTRGPAVRGLRAQLYTFGGAQVAAGKALGVLHSSRTVTMRTRLGRMQPGRYTLVLTGEPNASRSCGPKKRVDVVRFRDCILTLPVAFPSAPRGRASDYGDFLTVRVAATGPVLRDVTATLFSPTGQRVDAVRIGTLFGQLSPGFRVPGGLRTGVYRVSVLGIIAAQPRSCGPKSTSISLVFS